jgi:predicted peroxiredoxin
MRFLYFSTTGVSDPVKATIPFHMAVNGSVPQGHEASIILAGDGAEIVIGGAGEKLEGLGLPPMRDLLAKVRELGLPVYV